jgi:hypothetical protein
MPDDASPYSGEGVHQREITVAELREFAEAVGLERAAPGRSSVIFMFQVYAHAVAPLLFAGYSKIVAEVRMLEGMGAPVGTKPAEQFRHPPLRGLCKKHYILGGISSVAANTMIAFGGNRRELHRIIQENYNPDTPGLWPLEISRNIANAAVGLYAERSRAQRLTGEWIIFAQHEGQNYYLCLGGHQEPDTEIFERIKNGCVAEFAFLRSQLGLVGDQN